MVTCEFVQVEGQLGFQVSYLLRLREPVSSEYVVGHGLEACCPGLPWMAMIGFQYLYKEHYVPMEFPGRMYVDQDSGKVMFQRIAPTGGWTFPVETVEKLRVTVDRWKVFPQYITRPQTKQV